MKAVVAAFNQEKALVGAFSVITNLWMEDLQQLQLLLTADDDELVLGHDDGGAAADRPLVTAHHTRVHTSEGGAAGATGLISQR